MVAPVDTFSDVLTTSGPLILTVPRAVAAGNSIVLATDRSDGSGAVGGIASIVDSRSNTWALHDAISLRTGTAEVALHHAHLTTGLQAGDTITVNWKQSPSTRKVVIAHVFSGLDTSKGATATSGTTVASNPSNSGPNGTTAAVSGSTATATAATSGLLVAAVGTTTTGGPLTPGAGFTAGASVATATGTADRQLSTEWRTTSTSGVKTADGTLAATATWAEAVAHYPAMSANIAPTAVAGADQTNVEPWSQVTVGGTDTDPDGTIASIAWTQTAGAPVTLSATNTAIVTFPAPATIAGTTVVLQKIVTDDAGTASPPDFVSVQVLPVTERAVIGGVEVPMRVFAV